MNRKQKILTILVLAIFAVISALHYLERANIWKTVMHETMGGSGFIERRAEQEWAGGYWTFTTDTKKTMLPDLRAPCFILAVFYAGLFFILATPRAKSPKS